jgi:hypothetical protein
VITLSLPGVSADWMPTADIEMAETADETEAVELTRALLEATDKQHLLVEFEQFFLAGLVRLRIGRALAIMIGRSRRGCARSWLSRAAGSWLRQCFRSFSRSNFVQL